MPDQYSPYREGWGVSITPLWDENEETGAEWISDIFVSVVRLSPQTEVIIGNTICAETEENFFVPMDNFQPLEDLWENDTHDLRDRWFATEREARDHAEYTERRFKNPAPWESFVKLD